MFEATDADAGEYKYVQFSDHNIAPTKAAHFHIFYGGESQEAPLMNWKIGQPTIQVNWQVKKLLKRCWRINIENLEKTGLSRLLFLHFEN